MTRRRAKPTRFPDQTNIWHLFDAGIIRQRTASAVTRSCVTLGQLRVWYARFERGESGAIPWVGPVALADVEQALMRVGRETDDQHR